MVKRSPPPPSLLPADEDVDERLTALQTEQRTMRDSLENLTTMVRSLLPRQHMLLSLPMKQNLISIEQNF